MNSRLYLLLALLLLSAANAKAQVKIYGNVYGGGEKAQVIAPDVETVKAQLIQDADLATLFTNVHTYTTYVRLGVNAEVYGRTFGGGMGHEDSRGESAGRVTGQTDVVLDGATVWSELFGGGENADVRGNTLLHFKKGKAGHNAFGGGLGMLGGTDATPDNQRTPLASADIKLIPADYNLIVNDNATNIATLKGYYNTDGTTDITSSNWLQEKKTGESFVVFDGDKENYTHYEFMTERKLVRNAQGEVVVGSDGKYYTENNQYDANRLSQLFTINHNIYGGGMTASKIEGKTFVHINYGMVNQEMMDYEVDSKKVWSNVYNSIANAQFCVFGGGYGYHSEVLGDTYVTMDIMGSGQYKYINEFTQWFATEGKTRYHWDTNTGTPENIYRAADEATWSHGAPGRSCMDVIGGGYNGRVLGTTHITIGGDVITRKVYGGGYYASVGNTDVNIKSGIFNRVYGGGLIGNVYGMATLNVGQQGTTDDIIKHNTHLMVKDAIYGGNDVSGTVGTTAAKQVTASNGVKYNVFSPVDDDNHGVRLNMYGGLVLGDVYGAGNGNHPGYTNPAHMQFNLSQHPSENYRKVIKPNTAAITADSYALVYKYRPRTGRVVMNLQGNSGNNFNDEPLVDKVRIWGRTFGGGNSCNVGIWNGEEDDNIEKYADDATSWHPGDNFNGQGHIMLNIGSHVQLGNRNDSHETPNGLFMGNNGEHMVTQTTDPKQLENYHHYFNPISKKYLPGFLVYDASGNDIGRKAGLKAFAAFINNILTWTDNVNLTINDDAQDVWMSNFVGGGYRGSMKAKTSSGKFAYTLPTGVTIGHSVVGGAFNAHIVYRVYESSNGDYVIENGKYKFLTTIPGGWVKDNGTNNGQYLDVLHEDPEHPDQITAILRYNFDGGIMGENSSSIAKADGSRCGLVKNNVALDFTSDTKYDKDKALVYLNLRNKLEPVVIAAQGDEPAKVHGGIVYGGCFISGYIDGDVWVDYRCSLSPTCTDERFFDKSKETLYTHVDNLEVHNALNVFGAGYGEDTHTMGDTYLRVLHNGSSDNSYDYPFVYNVFGGGNMGTVAGNTNVYFNVGTKGTVVGSLYGGGYRGKIDGNTFVELAGGLLLNAYGGSRQANIGGASHVWAYDGAKRSGGEDETKPESAPLLIGNIYGGNDISGTIGTADNGMEAIWTKNTWSELEGKKFNSYVQVGGTEASTNGYPLIGNIYAGGNGANTLVGTPAPDVAKTLLEINDGTTVRAFGGGNKATVTDAAYILVNAASNNYAQFTFNDYQKNVINNIVFNNIYQGFRWEGNQLTLDRFHTSYLYGGNNLAPMAIQPNWNLLKGHLGNVYSGGNLGDMTNPNGINITVSSPTIFIDNLFGGCRMADVKPTAIAGQESAFTTYWSNTDNYGATVNCTGGYIGNVYGGNDISGTVAHGTKVVIDGAVDNDVYCAGNGNYLYKWDATVTQVTEVKEGEDVIYKVPAMAMFGGAEATPTQKLLTINAYRPSVDRSALDIEGAEESVQDQQDPAIKVAFVKGNVYCGGNASTVTGNAATKLTIGSHVNIHGLFMGSDGYDFSQQEAIAKFEKLNGFDMTAATDFTGLKYDEGEGQVPATSMTPAEETYYPNLLALYMKAVEMQSLPTLSIANDVRDAYIGTWCGGGNRGSMTAQVPVTVTIPENITIYDKVVAGCMDANVKYVGASAIEDTGGYYRPLTSGTTKLNYTINAKFLPRYMSVPAGVDVNNPEGDNFLTARGKYFLYENKTGTGATAQYNIGNNIYGGCYESGDVLGDVVLNVNSNLLEEPLKNDNGSQPNREKLNNTSRNEVAAFNVYGAGMGMESNVWGSVTINMNGNANNVYGGGRSGTLIGNATINMKNGIVYRHIIGGSDAGNMYGSTQIAVGKPTVYKAPSTAEYTLTRADEGLTNKIRLAQGDLISEALYDMLTEKSGFTPSTSDHTLNSIYIGGGIYGGGYALATGSTVFAGSTTVYKYTNTMCPKDPNTGDLINGLAGYGGNANIMVKDNTATDNIAISSNLNGAGGGGIFGDGHLSFVAGFRSMDIQDYGYATGTISNPKTLNTIQRFDVARVKDCCLKLEGARDFATNSTDATTYSMSRVRELQLASSITGSSLSTETNVAKIRNYVEFSKNVRFVGALKSDVAFDAIMFNESGTQQSSTYQAYKQKIISTCYNITGKENEFKTRNLGTAKNMIGFNTGYSLKLQKETSGSTVLYGPAKGVTEVRLITLENGEGGGYIYAKNIHDTQDNFLNTSGNFVFQGKGTSPNIQYIVDDCFPGKFSGTATEAAHYWYVEGTKYFFNGTITGYTANKTAPIVFNLDNHDQIITLSGTTASSTIKLKSITWNHTHSGSPYSCDIANTEKDYTFSLSASSTATYNTDGAYLATLSRSTCSTETTLTGTPTDNPLLGIQLSDGVSNNEPGYYEQHLKEPCKATIVLESDNKYTYTMNLDVVYLKGPSVEGTVIIDNCALPGEYIHAHVDGLKIETNEGMAVTATKWQVKHGGTTEIVDRMNTTEIDNSIIDLKALYKHNGYQLQYVVVANGVDFPISVANDATMKTLTVHNYHKMADVQERQSNETLKLDPQAGARVYINNEADLVAFGQWINAGHTTEGMHFYIQNDLTLPADWNITGTFAGTLHGDGYVLTFPETEGNKTLFGDKLTGTVYNLGVDNGAIASTGTMTNCFDNTVNEADRKYGKKAYELSHYHNATDNATYVTTYYTGDDWRYARTTTENTTSKTYLRTGTPAYGSVSTAHNTAHGTAYTPVAHDYLFFGQALKPNGDVHPEHIANDEANRVLETEGYYNSNNDEKFYYNTAAAWAMQPGLTAVRFDNTKETGEGCKPSVIGATADVTRNLLVYEADDAIVDHFSQSFFHVRGSKPNGETQNVFRVDNLSLHDMQDFNAPYAFTATNASYERIPAHFVEARGTAWESLCLPFAPTSVKAINGSNEKTITHFYGAANTANIDGTAGQNNANNVGHEYWLRELIGSKNESDKHYAQFSRPADANYVAYRPYIVSFPGSKFYEFDLTGSNIRWEKASAVINVTDDATKSMTANGYTYTGAFANDNDNKFVMNSDGSAFVSGAVVPFRGYLSAAASAQSRSVVYIGSDYDDIIPGEDHEDDEHGFTPEGEQTAVFKISVKGHEVTVISSDEMQRPCYTAAGASLGMWMIPEGESHFTVPGPGIYILNGIKFVVK